MLVNYHTDSHLSQHFIFVWPLLYMLWVEAVICNCFVFLSYSQDSSELCRSRSNTGGPGVKVTGLESIGWAWVSWNFHLSLVTVDMNMTYRTISFDDFRCSTQNGRAASLETRDHHLSFCHSQERDSFLVKNYAHLSDKARGVFMDSGLKKAESGSCCVWTTLATWGSKVVVPGPPLHDGGISWDLACSIGFRKWVQLISCDLSVWQRDPLTQSTLWVVRCHDIYSASLFSYFSCQKG